MDNNTRITGKHSQQEIEAYLLKRQYKSLTRKDIKMSTLWHNLRVTVKFLK